VTYPAYDLTMNSEFDLNKRPLVVIWETTQACDLACYHCRASAQPKRHPQELTTAEAESMMRDVAALDPPIFILTGGDPLKRFDIYHLVRYAISLGLKPAMTPSATPLLTQTAIQELKNAGLSRLAVSLDGSNPGLHDGFRGVPGSFERTLNSIRWSNAAHLPIQVNTTISTRNLNDLDNMAKLLQDFRIVLWSIFFLVPTGRGQADDLPTGEQFEQVFKKLHQFSTDMPFRIKTTEAQHYRRFVIQQRAKRKGNGSIQPFMPGMEKMVPGLLPINDGKGFVFISHKGEVFPSGFLPVCAGNVHFQTITDIYQNSELLKALTGDMFAQESCCIYQPQHHRAAVEEVIQVS
jgi:AdoMet-dependent heme synthase